VKSFKAALKTNNIMNYSVAQKTHNWPLFSKKGCKYLYFTR